MYDEFSVENVITKITFSTLIIGFLRWNITYVTLCSVSRVIRAIRMNKLSSKI